MVQGVSAVPKVQHVIKTGLKHGKYYKVYVTQVNQAGIESAKSVPDLIRVGDVAPPPVPSLSVDYFAKNIGLVDVGLFWAIDQTDDLDHFIVYTWLTLDDYSADGVYPKALTATSATQRRVTGSTREYRLTGQRNGEYVWIGIQAVDTSNNASDIYIIRTLPEDNRALERPNDAIHVVPGVWLITITVDCSYSRQIASVLIYRDNVTLIAVVPFISGGTATAVDNLAVMDGLTHFYTYAYQDRNGNISPRSTASATVTAKTIDTDMIDKATFEALNKAWNVENVNDIKALKESLLNQAGTIQSLATQLSTVTSNYNALYNDYTVVANNINFISAKVTQLESTTSSMQTQISQNAYAISLRATKIDTDNAISNVQSASTALINVQADRINNIVSNLNGSGMAYSAISQLSDRIQLKVDRNGVVSAINMSPETIDISGSRIVINGDTLFTRDARINGTLEAGVVSADAIYQAGYQIKATVMVRGVVANQQTIPIPSGYTQEQCVWGVLAPTQRGDVYTICEIGMNRVVTAMARYSGGELPDSTISISAYYWIMGVK